MSEEVFESSETSNTLARKKNVEIDWADSPTMGIHRSGHVPEVAPAIRDALRQGKATGTKQLLLSQSS